MRIDVTEKGIRISRPHPCVLPALDTPVSFFGAGPSGFAIASLLAFSIRSDVRFVRPAAKGHGLELQVEGPFTSWDTPKVVVLLDEPVTLPRELANARILRVIPDLVALSQTPDTQSADRHQIERLLQSKSGRFLLSSGKTGCVYIDAIPALTSYESVMQVATSIRELCNVDVILAPAYGGVSLAVAVGLRYGIDVVIPNVAVGREASELAQEMSDQGQRVLIVDDFTSTGSTLQRYFAPLMATDLATVFSLCVSADAALSGTNLHWLFRFDGEALHGAPPDGLGMTPPAKID